MSAKPNHNVNRTATSLCAVASGYVQRSTSTSKDSMSKLKTIAVTVLLVMGLVGVSSVWAAEMRIPCSDAPKEAVVDASEKTRGLAGVTCTKYGHLLSGEGKMLWNYSGAFSPALIFANPEVAKLRTEPPVVNHASHFAAILTRDLTQKELEESFKGRLVGIARSEKPLGGIVIIATNQAGLEQRAYFFELAGEARWGYLCTPDCNTDMPFMLLDMSRKKK
jgi:hypothetical protein